MLNQQRSDTGRRRPIAMTLAAAFLAVQVAGCAQLALQAVSMGAMVSVDRRTAGAQLEDETIQLKAVAALKQALGSSINVQVTSHNRQVLLTGEVPDAASKTLAQRLVGQVENVRTVYNELAVENLTTLVQRGSDAYLTARVRAAFFDAPDLSSNAFKVVTSRSTVYLMGLVTPRESERAVRITQQVNGVQRIVKVFEVIGEEELAQTG
ncbi:MAG: BON domain-containing protein, partial [Ramlibacter sp.]